MAEKIARPKVILNGKQIESELNKLTAKSNELRTALKNAVKINSDPKGIKKLKREIRSVDKESRNLKKEMINVDRVIKDINGESMANIRKAFYKQSKIVQSLRKDSRKYNAELEKQNRLKSAMTSMNGSLTKQKSIISKLTGAFNNYFAIITAGAAAATGLVMAVQKAVDAKMQREDMKGNVKALTNLGDESITFLEQKAIEYATTVTKEGIRIQKSGDEILKAFQLVGSAQPALLKDKEALASVTREMLILAEAGENGITLEDAIDSVTKAMNQYGAAASETSRFTNAMAAGAQKGAVPVNEIGLSIKEFGVNAKAAHVPIEQSVALIEILGEKAGVTGPRAGIQMRNFFAILAKGPKETNPEIVGLQKALENLDKQNLSSGEYSKIFGMRNANVARILVAQKGYLQDMTTALTGTDTAYQQAITNTIDQKAALAQAKNKMHEVTLELGEYLAPAMKHVIRTGSTTIKMLLKLIKLFIKYKGEIIILSSALIAYKVITLAVVAAKKLEAFWSKLTTRSIITETGVTKAAAIVKAVLTGKIKLATIAQRAWNLAQKANPIGLIVGILSAAAIAVYHYYKKTKELSEQQKELKKQNEAFADSVAESTGKMNNLFDQLKKTNKGSRTRARLIKEINDKYETYLPNLLTEESTLEDIKKAQKAANTELINNIALKFQNEDKSKIFTARIKREQLAFKELAKKHNVSVASMSEAYNDFLETSKDGYGTFGDLTSLIALVPDILQMKNRASMRTIIELGKARKKDETELQNITDLYSVYITKLEETQKIEGDNTTEEDKIEADKKALAAAKALQKALWQLRLKYHLIKQEELYKHELAEFKANKASHKLKLKSEDEYQQALKAIYDKYHKPSAQTNEEVQTTPVEMEPEQEVQDDTTSVDFKREVDDYNYQDEQYKNSLDYQYDLLQQQWEKGEIGEDRHNAKLNALDEERRKKLSEQLVGGMQHAHDMASQFISVLSSSYKMQESDALKRIENQKEKGIISEEEAEKQKAKIQEKYAKKQKELALKQAYIDIALAEIKAIASAPWPVNIPALAYATAQGIASVAAIKAQEYEIGGYTNKGLNSKPAGIVHENEFVANAEATGNASVDRVLNIIDLAQKNGTISTLDLPAAIYKLNLIKGLQSGGYVSETVNNNNINNSIDIESLNHAAYLIYEAAVIFKNKQLILTAEGVKKITETGKEIEIQNVIS